MITIVYDNKSSAPRLEADWGFACVVHGLEKTILFDTGASGDVLLGNMKELDIAPAAIDVVVLSHNHWDHTGGLAGFLNQSSDVSVYVPSIFPRGFKQNIWQAGAEVVETDGPAQVCQGAFTTGVIGGAIKEQGLYLETLAGAVLITGCAHPGVVELTRAAKAAAAGPVHTVFGGFHMGDDDSGRIAHVIEELKGLGVVRVGPCHCSGQMAQDMMREAFGGDYLDLAVGRRVELA